MTVRFVTLDNGLSIRTIESGPAPAGSSTPSGTSSDAAVILVHGWSASVYSFAEMIPVLSAAGHRVIALDLPGHGLSDKPTNEATYSTPALADVVLDVADALGVRRFSLVAHSMGGSLALELATRGERRLERLALINAVGLSAAPFITPIKLASPRIVDRIVPLLLFRTTIAVVLRIAFGTLDRPNNRDIDEYWAPTQFDEFARACRACIHCVNWRRVPATKLRSLRIPVLVISGGRDLIVRGSGRRARLIPGARIVTIREGGHLVMQECAHRTNAELLLFLRGERQGR